MLMSYAGGEFSLRIRDKNLHNFLATELKTKSMAWSDRFIFQRQKETAIKTKTLDYNAAKPNAESGSLISLDLKSVKGNDGSMKSDA